MLKVICIISLLFVSLSTQLGKKLSPPNAVILNQILNDTVYAKEEVPPFFKNKTTTLEVSVQTLIRNFNSFDDVRQEVGAQLTLRLIWTDDRHSYENLQSNKGLPVPESISFSNADRIWFPDVFVTNEKSGYSHNILHPNVLVRIYKNGTTMISFRITIVIYCPMRVHWFPFDKHGCEFQFSSYSQLLRTW